MQDSLGDRMKDYYENRWKISLPMRIPVILRVDGKSFHTLTRNFEKPFDFCFISVMNTVAKELCSNIQGAQFAFVQSDEISILLHNYKKLNSAAWFANEIQKMVSVSASIASVCFSFCASSIFGRTMHAFFDSRVFVLPEAEVCNYFLWRQRDWERNSIQMLARSLYSHKELKGKKNSELQELCFKRGKNWNDLETFLKRGRCCINKEGMGWGIDNNIPIFSQSRYYIEKFLAIEEA